MLSKEKMAMIFAEFFGTALLASVVLVALDLFGGGTAAWYTALTAGVALSLIVALFGRVSGAHVNPAVTIGLWTQKKIETTNAIVYIAAQLLGGLAALSFFNYVTGVNLASVDPGAFEWSVFWAEAVGAGIFGMGIVAAITQKLEGYYAAFTIGLSLTFGALVASLGSAGFLNPAVALGNNAWSGTLVAAPIVGMVVGMYLYMMFIAPAKSLRKRK